jgi:HPt (histidine-containing phosphotransfer) domain-containing protein
MTTDNPLDEATWDDLRAMGRDAADAMLCELIGLYLEDAPALLQAIQAAHERMDARGLAFHAHALRSPSASLGALTLAEACRRLEEAAAMLPDPWPDSGLEPTLVLDVLNEAGRVVSALQERRRP